MFLLSSTIFKINLFKINLSGTLSECQTIWIQICLPDLYRNGLTIWFDRMYTIRVSNHLDPDQDRHFVGPDLCLFCCFTDESTAMVMVGQSVHPTTLFPGQA